MGKVCISTRWKCKDPDPGPKSKNWFVILTKCRIYLELDPIAASGHSLGSLLTWDQENVEGFLSVLICSNPPCSDSPRAARACAENKLPRIATCKTQSPHPYPSFSVSVFSSRSPSPSSSSHPPLHHAGSLVFLKTSARAWKGTRQRGASTWGATEDVFVVPLPLWLLQASLWSILRKPGPRHSGQALGPHVLPGEAGVTLSLVGAIKRSVNWNSGKHFRIKSAWNPMDCNSITQRGQMWCGEIVSAGQTGHTPFPV